MTITTPNLGKLFTSCTCRPVTTEDIKILSEGDWISEKECPWSWKFKNFCQDMAVGVWEGKEFFVPINLLMVCTVVETNPIEKFLKSDSKFKVGSCVEWRKFPKTIYKIIKPVVGGHVTIELAENFNIKPKPPHRKRVALWKIKLLEHTSGTDLGFKKGDRVRDTFMPLKPRSGMITDTPEKWAIVHWDGVEHSANGQQWSYEYLEKIENWTVADENAEIKPVLPPDAPIAVVLFAGGGGVEAGMVEAGIRPLVAVEFDPKKPKLSSAIADTHERNFGEYGCKVIRQTVQEVARIGFLGFPLNPDHLHASPMCSNFSPAKAGGAVETTEDMEMASAVASAIRYLKPKFFTLENVKRYSSSQSFKIIVQALDEEGYTWRCEIITLLDCQARERFIVRATKGWLPPLPDPVQLLGWHEVIADLIPSMKHSELVPGQKKALDKFLASNKPTPLLIDRVGGRGGYKAKPAHLRCSTIVRSHFTDGKGANRNKFADIWLPDGTIKSLSIEAAARLQGFPNWYKFPPDTATAGSIIGYSVPPKFAAQLFKSLQQAPPIEVQIHSCQERIIQHNWHIQNLEAESKQTKTIKEAIKSNKGAIASLVQRVDQLLEELIIYRQFLALGCDQYQARVEVLKLLNYGN
ncbi:MAG: DNA cytosine methyltransferase [Nostoc sp.]|uniref:DNA cytosine methyltransferase n=1 Tax=Nostoc sp. TaxID=1180 RepID=UPI002FFA5B4D